MIIMLTGLPGSGKSFFGRRLAKSMDAEYLSSDNIRKELFSNRTYSAEEKQKVYSEMQNRMKAAVKEGKDVVLDATFYKRDLRKRFISMAENLDESLVYIEIRAHDAIIRERLNREREESDADYEVYLKIKEQFEPMETEHLVLTSTRDNIDEMLTKALNYINERNG